MALPLGMWQVLFVFAGVASLYLSQSRKVLWAIPTLVAWVIIVNTSTNVAVVDGGTTTTFGSPAIGYLAVFMAAFTFIQLVIYGLLPGEDPQGDEVEASPEGVIGSVSDHMEDSL